MAFFFHSTAAGRVQAFYPSPMGPTESLLGLEAWAELERANPVLGTLAPDVEALLVNRARGARGHWIVPIDECYALVGLIRTHWRGFTGGAEVWEELARFFETLDRRAKPATRTRKGAHDMPKLRLGGAQTPTDAPTHIKGVKQGNSKGNYEKQVGHLPDGRRTAASVDGHQPGAARADRPAHAEPAAGLAGMAAARPLAGPVPELAFAVLDAAPLPHAAAPTLAFSLRIDCPDGPPVRSILLDTQVQIAARRRAYDERAQARLFELFGPVKDWGGTLRTLLWTRTTLAVPPFTGTTVVELPVPCTYDLEVAASRYLDALGDGEVPLELLFSGTVFYAGAGGRLQAARISWEGDAEYRLPVRVWRATMDAHFPGTAWLRLPKASFDRLCAYRARHALPGWEETVDALLEEE